ncbi:MAG: SbcC/MukB-like Walker B domain-containing protein, partial [Nocardioides sp.]|uniref:SbcC/MukB-like Walker B domain-containing protein n=1 Tax=Nocardioides sp. TaxID=35761 RepID=UPI003F0613A9
SLLDAASATAERQERAARLGESRRRLAAAAEQVEAARATLVRARATESVHPVHGAHRRAVRRLEDVRAAAEKAESHYAELCGQAPSDLAAQRDAWVSERGQLQRGLEAERTAAVVEAGLAAREREIATRSAQQTAWRDEAQRHRDVLAVVPSVSVPQAEATLTALRFEHALARRHAEARQEAESCERAALLAGQARTEASAVVVEVRRALLDGYAGTLAQSLSDHEQCPVCGSREHPAPAPVDPSGVLPGDVDAAEDALRQAQQHASALEQAAAAARALVEETKGARGEEVLAAALADATVALAVARDEATRREISTAELARLQTSLHAGEVELTRLTAEHDAQRTEIDRLRAEVDLARGDCDTVAARSSALEDQIAAVDALLSVSTDLVAAESAHEEATSALDAALEAAGFAGADAYLAAVLTPEQSRTIESRVRAHDDEAAATTAALQDPSLQGLPTDPVDVEGPRHASAEADQALHATLRAHGVAVERLRTAESLAEQVRTGWGRSERERRTYETVQRLARSVHGDSPNTRRLRLESYVLAAELVEVTRAANGRLGEMSAGRYSLHVSDEPATRGNNAGLDVRVLDAHTGTARAPESLSGGERFLASLALALGLAEVVTQRAGGITLDTLFVDEGFGSLDAQTLDLVMQVLDGLREHGRTVGVISHVATMQERIPAQAVVTPQAGGWSELTSLS